ncbi:CSD domain-containing protein [Psidium guajava]|nr:CSD domain-containing protein [Psidium guajava]
MFNRVEISGLIRTEKYRNKTQSSTDFEKKAKIKHVIRRFRGTLNTNQAGRCSNGYKFDAHCRRKMTHPRWDPLRLHQSGCTNINVC